MKIARTIAYWTTTGLLSLAMLGSSAGYLSGTMDEAISQLGYPPSFTVLMGILKGLGAIALLIPALPRAKEWVYAGFFFNFVGAMWAHGAIGDAARLGAPAVMLVLLLASYLLRPERLWLGGSIWRSSDDDDVHVSSGVAGLAK